MARMLANLDQRESDVQKAVCEQRVKWIIRRPDRSVICHVCDQEKHVAWALAQVGEPYVRIANGKHDGIASGCEFPRG